MNPIVSVVSTCFNQRELVGDAIESVLDQDTHAIVRHVIVDDGSTDGSLERLREYEAEYRGRVQVLSVTNRGFPGALNAGLLASIPFTEFVVTLPGDDWLADNYIAECLSAVGDADVVVTGMQRVGWDDRYEFPEVQHPTVDQLWAWEQTYVWSVAMIRMSALVETGGFHPLTGGDCDWDMWIDLASRGARFAYTRGTHYFYRYNEDSLNRYKTAEQWDLARIEMQRHHRRNTLPGPEFA